MVGKLSDLINHACRIVAGGFLAALLVIVLIQVAMRYFGGFPPAWTEEFARYAMIWAGFLGATVAFKAGADPVLFRLSNLENRTVRFAAGFVQALAVVLFLSPILIFSFAGADLGVGNGFLERALITTVDTAGVPMIFVSAVVPLAAAIILMHLFAGWFRNSAAKSVEFPVL